MYDVTSVVIDAVSMQLSSEYLNVNIGGCYLNMYYQDWINKSAWWERASDITQGVNISKAIHWLRVFEKAYQRKYIRHCFQKYRFKITRSTDFGPGSDREFESLFWQVSCVDDVSVKRFIDFNYNFITFIWMTWNYNFITLTDVKTCRYKDYLWSLTIEQ